MYTEIKLLSEDEVEMDHLIWYKPFGYLSLTDSLI